MSKLRGIEAITTDGNLDYSKVEFFLKEHPKLTIKLAKLMVRTKKNFPGRERVVALIKEYKEVSKNGD